MTHIVLWVSLVVLASAWSSAFAEAGQRKRSPETRATRSSDSADAPRAHTLDPSREFKYPDWARKALGPKSSGGRS